MGELGAAHSPGRAYSPMVGAEIQTGANGMLRLPLKPAWEHTLVVIEGEVQLDGTRLAPGALHYLGARREGMELKSRAPARAVLIGGAPFGESIVIWWNFVARTADEIRAARDDWQTGDRFGTVKAYQGARIEAPELLGRPVASQPNQ
jgi:redox-sensitive bicupin YhaK (pirin superfamily)